MIPTILIVSLAFYWLLRESRWLTIRLSGAPELKSTGIKALTSNLLPAIPRSFVFKTQYVTPEIMTTPKPKQVLLLDTYRVKPSQFIPLEMPGFTGTINILCQIEESAK